MAYYRKYRPQVLEEIDNSRVREQLESFLSKKREDLPHAYLLTGPKGAGKTTSARLIAKLFNCEKPKKSGAPCGSCTTCVAIAEGRYMDVLELDAASNRGIDEIRQLRDTIALAPSQGEYKIYIIDEVHMLTAEAFNALLKTLEEPPKHAVFVLATTDVNKVPATIISRCIHIAFSRAHTDDLIHALDRIVDEEKIKIDADALQLIAQSADGAFRDAVKILEQVSFQKGKINAEMVRNLLALSTNKSVADFLGSFLARDAKKALDEVALIIKNGMDSKTFLVQCLRYLEGELVGNVSGSLPKRWDVQALTKAIDTLTNAYGELRISPIPQLPLELAVVEFCNEEEQSQVESSDTNVSIDSSDALTLDKLLEHWRDVIESTKPYNHSVAGMLRSTRPKSVRSGIVTIEAFYKFHQEKLSETKTKEALRAVLKKLFGENVKVDIVLGKK